MRTVIYLRVSTDAQERDGTSLDSQHEACIAYAQQHGWQVLDVIREAASGYSLDRDGLDRLRSLLRDGRAEMILSYAVDRLSRNQNHIGVLFDEIATAGAHLEFVTESFEDTAVGRFILAARAFSAEVEREKIVERTTRGKTQRARSGRMPQGTGKGCYGYRYDSASGQRKVDEYQAAVVRRTFQRYAETRSFSAVSQELNTAGVPAFGGGRWYPLTIRRILTNESYAGNFVYRRVKRVLGRRGQGGKRRSEIVLRPLEDRINIEGASPRIVDQALWDRVQEIITDPERTKVRPQTNHYELRGRARCAVCGAAMVGQTLRSNGYSYRYYRCRHLYDKNTKYSCAARYVGADKLETGVWREIVRVLTDPNIVLAELNRHQDDVTDTGEAERVEAELAKVDEQMRRLLRMYTTGDFGEELVREQAASLRAQKVILEDALRAVRKPVASQSLPKTVYDLCQSIAAWLENASPEHRLLALEALEAQVTAARTHANLVGVLPIEAPEFLSVRDPHADVRSMVSNVEGFPFHIELVVTPRRQKALASAGK